MTDLLHLILCVSVCPAWRPGIIWKQGSFALHAQHPEEEVITSHLNARKLPTASVRDGVPWSSGGLCGQQARATSHAPPPLLRPGGTKDSNFVDRPRWHSTPQLCFWACTEAHCRGGWCGTSVVCRPWEAQSLSPRPLLNPISVTAAIG